MAVNLYCVSLGSFAKMKKKTSELIGVTVGVLYSFYYCLGILMLSTFLLLLVWNFRLPFCLKILLTFWELLLSLIVIFN